MVAVVILWGCSPSRADGEWEASQATDYLAAQYQLLPENHLVDWMQRHSHVARAQSQDCMDCHREQDCTSCHNEYAARPYTVHPPNYIVVHSMDARLDTANCTSCHQVETFCTTCHIQANVALIPPSQPPVRLAVHPPGWLDAAHPGNHGVLARRNIADCASCHTETDCITCHVGINPHPPDFRLDCAGWLKANPRPCAQCHGNMAALHALCP